MATSSSPSRRPSRWAILGCWGLLIAPGCDANPDGPVRSSGSIDIPDAVLKERAAAAIPARARAKLDQQSRPPATPADAPAKP